MIGERIRALRLGLGLNQAELARRIGIKQPSLWDIEAGETKSLRADTLMRLAQALDTNPVYLWTGRGSPVAHIDPNIEEAEVVAVYRRMTPHNRSIWVQMGNGLIAGQPSDPPSVANPFPSKRRSR